MQASLVTTTLLALLAIVSAQQTCYKTTSNLNLRNGPSTNNLVLTTIPSGSVVVKAGNQQGDWYNVKYNSATGWVNSGYVTGAACSGGQVPVPVPPGSKLYTRGSRPNGPEYTVESVPTISPALFEQVLRNAKSPALNQGYQAVDYYRAAQRMGINPAVALAFFEHESSLGRDGAGMINFNWGNLRPSSNGNIGRAVSVNDNFRKYRNFYDSMLDWCDLMLKPIYKGKTIRQIVAIYAPGSDGNNPDSYASIVLRRIHQWNDQSGDFYAESVDSADFLPSELRSIPSQKSSSLMILVLGVAVIILGAALTVVAVLHRRAKRLNAELAEPLAEASTAFEEL